MSDPIPDSPRLMQAIDVTWPPAETARRGDWVLRRGAGGGKRVSAASGTGDPAVAADAMRAWGQAPLYRLTPEDGALDSALAASGHRLADPVALYAAPAEAMTGSQSHMAAGYTCQCRLAIMEDIWAAGGIGPDRLAIMDRVRAPHRLLMSRAGERPAGVGFVALDGDVAMIHAIEVSPVYRRMGAARLLIEAAARFAHEQGASWLALAVTEANGPARALYEALGMTVAGRYHYRIDPGKEPT